jgi:hypothetical protein
MSPLTVSAIVFACACGGALFGMVLRTILPEKHLSAESKDLVRLGMGLIGTMTALVLGLLVASAKSSFDTQRNGVAQLSANVIMLDRLLARYGTEAKDARDMLRVSVDDMLQNTWPDEYSEAGVTQTSTRTEGKYEGLYEKIQELTPKNDAQRAYQAQALKIATDTAQARWLLFAQKNSSIPPAFLVVMFFWITLLMTSFSLFAPPNSVVFATLLVCALAVSSAVFLFMELDQPYGGIIHVSSDPLRDAQAQLGR